MKNNNLRCIPGYTWDDVRWLGNEHLSSYYLTRDGKLWNDKVGTWISTRSGVGVSVTADGHKSTSVNINYLVGKYFTLEKLFAEGYVEVPNLPMLINKQGKVYNVLTYQFAEQYLNANGDPSVTIGNKCYQIHRLLAEVFIINPNPVANIQVIHLDGNHQNNDLLNLAWSSQSERDRLDTADGALSLVDLSKEEMGDIRTKYQNGMSKSSLSSMYNIRPSILDLILAGGSIENNHHDNDNRKNYIRDTVVNNDRHIVAPEKQDAVEMSKRLVVRYTKDELSSMGFVPILDGLVYIHRDGRIYDTAFGGFKTAYLDKSSSNCRVKIGGKNYSVAKWFATTFVPNPDPKRAIWINHMDGNLLNNCADNLEWAYPADRTLRAVADGRPTDKVNFELADAIRKDKQAGATYDELVAKYHLSKCTLLNIVLNRSWVRKEA